MNYKEFEQIAKEWNGKICMFGAGLIGKTWGYEIAKAAGFSIDFYCDNNIKAGIIIKNGIKTISLEELYFYGEKVLVLLTMKESNQDKIIAQFQQHQVNNIISMGDMFAQKIYFSIEMENNDEISHKYRMFMDDVEFLKMRFKEIMGYPLNLDNPKTFNEKLNWLKIYNRKEEYIAMVDKVDVKEYVSSIIGKEYIVPTYGVWNSFDEIDFDMLPQQFVIKTTNDSGSVVICKDKNKFDKVTARKKIQIGLKSNYYIASREWPYKRIIPRIIVEEYIEDKKTSELRDYKFFVFNGDVKAMFIASERQKSGEETKFDFYDDQFNRLDLINGHPNAREPLDIPVNFERMKYLAIKIAKKIPHVRVDFYEVDGRVYFGEITFFHWSGMMPFHPFKWDYIWGDWIRLPK